MFPVTPRAAAGGFTLLELMVVLAVTGILLAVGVPRMTSWTLATKAAAAGELYADGFRLARQQALGHNAASRIVLTPNAVNGQLDWQVDICFPTPVVPCSDVSGSWSTSQAIAAGDPEGDSGYKSVFRPATALPQAEVLQPTLLPEGSTGAYFTSLGWVNTGIAGYLTRIQLVPTAAYRSQLQATAVVLNLAGTAVKCNPDAAIAAADSRACPP